MDRKYTAFNTSGSGDNVNAAMRDEWEAACKEASGPGTSPATPAPESANAPPGGTDVCVSRWTVAYRRKTGDDSIATADQLGEWQEWCKAGKLPR